MNSQLFPGLSESLIRQEHERLLEEAERSRLLRQKKLSESVHSYQFSINWMQKTEKNVPLTKTSVFPIRTR